MESEVENMSKALDLTGNKYGLLTVLKRVENSPNGHSNWLCLCECGNYTTVNSGHLREKRGTKSCGCLSKKAGERSYKHGETNNRLYRVWSGMRKRCLSPQSEPYKDYGGRGIRICKEWDGDNGYVNFREWAYANGYDENAPRGECTLDRIDVNGHYEPSNCRWVNMKVQSRNRRNTCFINYKGEKIALTELCERLNTNYDVVYKKINLNGKSIEEALEYGKQKI